MFHSFTRTYGYFAIFPFVAPWVRHWKTGWLMDHYADAEEPLRSRIPPTRSSNDRLEDHRDKLERAALFRSARRRGDYAALGFIPSRSNLTGSSRSVPASKSHWAQPRPRGSLRDARGRLRNQLSNAVKARSPSWRQQREVGAERAPIRQGAPGAANRPAPERSALCQ